MTRNKRAWRAACRRKGVTLAIVDGAIRSIYLPHLAAYLSRPGPLSRRLGWA